jgi:hypothetical protein
MYRNSGRGVVAPSENFVKKTRMYKSVTYGMARLRAGRELRIVFPNELMPL